MTIDHWMMFGTFAQQNFFAYPSKDSYTGVIFNANMVAHAPAGLAGFLHEKTAETNYVIDPLTHAFQHDPSLISTNDGKVKSSIRGIAEEYGEPVSGLIGSRPLLPEHISDNAILAGFVERCVQFQTQFLPGYLQKTDAAKYLPEDEREKPPYAVIAPYFFMSETTLNDWLPINIDCIRETRRCTGEAQRVLGSIVIDQAILEDDDSRKRITDEYSSTDCDGFIIWIDNFDEHAASIRELRALVSLGHSLRGKERDREVINLHGGFFSILAASKLGGEALSGVTHGPEFGEYRGVVPVGGGIPISRFYIPQLHSRVRYRDALSMLRELNWLDSAAAFHANICDCPVCVETLSGNPDAFSKFGAGTVKSVRRRHGMVRITFPTKEARDRCLMHYLQRKNREFESSSTLDPQTLTRSVSRGFHQFREVAGLDGVKHLQRWLRALGHDIVPKEDL